MSDEDTNNVVESINKTEKLSNIVILVAVLVTLVMVFAITLRVFQVI